MSASILRSARLISLLTLASRVLGLVRDMALASAFGTSSVASAFGTAFQIPNLFRRLFGEGAISAASIPVITETLTQRGRESADALAGRLMGLLLLVLAAICLFAEAVVAGLYWLYAADTDSALLLGLTALMLPYLIFICAAAVLGGVQNVFGRFASAASAPIILNLFMIAAILGGQRLFGNMGLESVKRRGIVLLSASVVFSGICQMAWQWAATRRCGLRLRLGIAWHDPAIRRITLTMLPMIAGLATIQLNVLADSLIAWWFVPEVVYDTAGADQRVGPAVLQYAQHLYQFPLGVFAIALATAIFPALSRSAAEKDFAGLAGTLSRGIRVAGFEGIPCLVGLILVREPLVRMLLGRGEFMRWPAAVDRVALALFMYALGIWAFSANQIVVRAFYAVGDAKTPLWVSVRNVALNLILNLLLVQTTLKEAGLALATSICAFLQVAILLHKLSGRLAHLAWREIAISTLRTCAASMVMAAGVILADYYWLGELRSSIRLTGQVSIGAAGFFAAARLFRCREIGELLRH